MPGWRLLALAAREKMHDSSTIGASITSAARKVRAAMRSVSINRDPDIEQAWLRISVCLVGFAYVWFLIITEGKISRGLAMGLFASFGDMAVGAAMMST